MLFLVAGAAAMWDRIRVQHTWQTVEAEVRLSEPVTFKRRDQVHYRTQIELAYSARGEFYSVPVSLPGSTPDVRVLNEQLQRYQREAPVPIFWNLANPEEIAVDHGSSDAAFYRLPLGLFGIGIVLLTLFTAMVARDGAYQCAVCGIGVAELHAFCFSCGGRIPSRKGKMRE